MYVYICVYFLCMFVRMDKKYITYILLIDLISTMNHKITSISLRVKLIYRHYATLYFVFAVDQQESDLGILDLIQVFVEALDKCFENVCELDLIFHSDKVHYVLDEIIMGGMVLETNIVQILQVIQDQNKLHQASQKISLPVKTSGR